MTHSNDLKGIGEKLNPTIYQIRFMKLGDWLSTSAQIVGVPLNYVQVQQRRI